MNLISSISPTWYKDFFKGAALEMWRRAVPPEITGKECEFLAQELSLAPGARVLDVPCGLGRHSLLLASRGFRVTGIDLSSEAIESARKDAARLGLQVELLNRDMCDLPPGEKFDGAFCMGNSFGYLSDGDNARFIAAVAGTLRPGGRFVLETGYAAESLLPHIAGYPPRYELGDVTLTLEHDYDPQTSRLLTTYGFLQNGVEEKQRGSQAVYTVRELKNFLAAAGFRVVSMYGGIDGKPYALGSRELIMVSEIQN